MYIYYEKLIDNFKAIHRQGLLYFYLLSEVVNWNVLLFNILCEKCSLSVHCITCTLLWCPYFKLVTHLSESDIIAHYIEIRYGNNTH